MKKTLRWKKAGIYSKNVGVLDLNARVRRIKLWSGGVGQV